MSATTTGTNTDILESANGMLSSVPSIGVSANIIKAIIFILVIGTLFYSWFKLIHNKEKLSKINRYLDKIYKPIHSRPVILFVSLIVFVLAIWLLYALFFLLGLESANEYGDAYGALNTLFSGFAFVGVITAIILQQEEMKETRAEFIEQNLTLKLQRFENTFFSMLSSQREIVTELKSNKEIGFHYFQTIYNNNIKTKLEHAEKPEELATLRDIYAKADLAQLDQYFRHLYRTIKLIDDAIFLNDHKLNHDSKDNEPLPKRYIAILCAQLSAYELIMIFYRGLQSDYEKTAKPLLEKYCFFEELRIERLVDKRHVLFYDIKTFKKEKVAEIFNS